MNNLITLIMVYPVYNLNQLFLKYPTSLNFYKNYLNKKYLVILCQSINFKINLNTTKYKINLMIGFITETMLHNTKQFIFEISTYQYNA